MELPDWKIFVLFNVLFLPESGPCEMNLVDGPVKMYIDKIQYFTSTWCLIYQLDFHDKWTSFAEEG